MMFIIGLRPRQEMLEISREYSQSSFPLSILNSSQEHLPPIATSPSASQNSSGFTSFMIFAIGTQRRISRQEHKVVAASEVVATFQPVFDELVQAV